MKLQLWACTKPATVVDRSEVKGLKAVSQCRLQQAVYYRTQDADHDEICTIEMQRSNLNATM